MVAYSVLGYCLEVMRGTEMRLWWKWWTYRGWCVVEDVDKCLGELLKCLSPVRLAMTSSRMSLFGCVTDYRRARSCCWRHWLLGSSSTFQSDSSTLRRRRVWCTTNRDSSFRRPKRSSRAIGPNAAASWTTSTTSTSCTLRSTRRICSTVPTATTASGLHPKLWPSPVSWPRIIWDAWRILEPRSGILQGCFGIQQVFWTGVSPSGVSPSGVSMKGINQPTNQFITTRWWIHSFC